MAETEHAGLGQRFVAIFVDSLLFAIIAVAISAVGAVYLSPELARILVNGVMLLYLVYFIVMEAQFGWTIGKRLVSIQVVSENGQPIGYKESLIRNVLRVIDSLLLYLVGAIAILGTDKNQRIGDIAGSTIVVPASAAQVPRTQSGRGQQQQPRQRRNTGRRQQ